ncbi:MAG: DUF2911 domain-containing protein [Ferruginibacter sp.]|nr:DUF2911 domain-containing protein [Ferruginibacter sp.]
MYWCIACLLFSIVVVSCAQKHKSKRESPPAEAKQIIGSTNLTIRYGQPSVKGRTIGVNLEPMPDKVWRAGANEATVFEVDKDVLVEGKLLPKGKYSFYILQQGGRSWNLIFNKAWNQWGTEYDQAKDVFRVPVRGSKPAEFSEKLVYKISPDGVVSLLWGDKQIDFQVQEKK